MLVARYESRFRGFHDLIRFRVREILLVSTLYDAFVLEEDRNLSERLFGEYVELDLRFVPRITRVSTGREALRRMKEHLVDVVLCMTRLPDMSPIEFRERAKRLDPDRPISFLTYDALDQNLRQLLRRSDGNDHIYYWFRDTNILTSIVKQVEDARNAPHDTRAGVQVILLVEDSPRYYSLYLPQIYTEILTQTRRLIAEGVNAIDRLQRMRARPKILHAETWEQAVALFRQYRYNVIGIISDVRFPRGGELVDDAGLRFTRMVKAEMPDMPVLLQSSDESLKVRAEACGAGFLHKESESLSHDLQAFILENFGFGDFVFRMGDGTEVGRAHNISQLYEMVTRIPDESLLYHARHNHFSTWLRARTEFKLADEMRPKKVSHFANTQGMRKDILRILAQVARPEQDGVVRDFAPGRLKAEHNFVRLGNGSLGGKARGLAFVNALLARNRLIADYGKVHVGIPNTFVLCTDWFEEFLDSNDLREWAMSADDDDAISRRFLEAELPRRLRVDLLFLLSSAKYPLAVRSSSLLEDNQTLPFAGIYRTYMVPNNSADIDVRCKQLCDAIKLVYASMFCRSPREYIKNTGYRLDEERMGVVLQELVGSRYGDLHYPVISGVARSYNFYPYSGLEAEQGVASLALGLGKAIVESEKVYHFCPAQPRINPPFASSFEVLRNTQTRFYALDLSRPDDPVSIHEDFSLRRVDISRAEADGTLMLVGSTYSPADGNIRDTLMVDGPRVIRFAQILKHGTLPVPQILTDPLQVGQKSFGSPVELEFAVEVDPRDPERASFHFLQIRPMVVDEASCRLGLRALGTPDVLCASVQAMGNGCYDDLCDLIYVDPDRFDLLRTRQIAQELEALNQGLADEGRRYVLLGFGRWATSDPNLGVPVQWQQVCQAQIFVEADRHDLWVEPSQGSHFFQNMLALRLGYLFVKESQRHSHLDWDWLQAQEPHQTTHFLRHLRFEEPLAVEIDGRTSRGVIRTPEGMR